LGSHVDTDDMIIFYDFPSIELFHNVVRFSEAFPDTVSKPLTYRGKVKLHGTCSGIRIVNKEVQAMSRTQFITPENDNAGFAKFVEETKQFWSQQNCDEDDNDITVFGEWCGPGIMGRTAINQIPNKVFAIFCVMVGVGETGLMVVDPHEIELFLGGVPPNTYILPWEGESFSVNFLDRPSLQETANMLNGVVARLEPCDPWVKATFGKDGICEGIVYYPIDEPELSRAKFTNFAFKAKGEAHKAAKTKEAVQVDPEVLKSIEGFVTMFVTEVRLEQALASLNQMVGGAIMKNVPLFLAWIEGDVVKESADELEASGLEWDQVKRAVQGAARTWYIAKMKAI